MTEKTKRKRYCPHCKKEIKPKPVKRVVHWYYHPCGCYSEDTCKATKSKEKVTCCNCANTLRQVKEGYEVECPECRKIHWRDKKYCDECGTKIKQIPDDE